ncbi:MAG: site-specific integrase [Erysipelotrichaceae bacterium]|nr:site-specific integrase [Erysipelotrichaceae bacterium]
MYRVHFTYQENGIKQTYDKRGFKTKKEAENHMILVKADIDKHGELIKECKLTFLQVYDEFLEVGTNKYQANTIHNTTKYYNDFSELLSYPITKINYAMLQRFFNKRKDKGIETNKNLKKAINRIFNYALDVGYIKINPITRVTVTGVENHINHDDVLSHDDFIKLTSALDEIGTFNYHAYSIAIQISYYTGLRVSEVCGLEKKDIDFENDLIDVNKKLVYKGLKKVELYTTQQMKSKKSKDIIPLFKDLKQVLIDWFEMNPYQKVICDKNGYYINPDVLAISVKRISKKLDIDFHFHMLRHSFATNLINSGVDIKTAQELLRHSNFNTTLTVYTHVNEEHKKDEINRVFESICVNSVSKTDSENLVN